MPDHTPMLVPLLATAIAMTQPVPDTLTPLGPSSIRLSGYLAPRVAANTDRLLRVDVEPLLAGYRRKPGTHPWIGEHIGKWMHAAALAVEHEADPGRKEALRARLEYAARELVKAQEPDGYLGTYVLEKRFGLYDGADWDVWSHKYCIIGLLAYHRVSGDGASLVAARKAADLLITIFGPGGKSIIGAGTHVGMAATSVLEPVAQLYRLTGEQKYLDFARRIVGAYDNEDGPRLLDALLSTRSVAATANGKAYEMLSNCVGLCELYRVTGEARFLDAARNAFDDVVANQLYITGSASHHEHFHDGHDLPNAMTANVGETCVTVTWIQLCEQLLRLTGEQKYAHEIERSVYNHLAGAQHPQRGDWCYYTSLDGTKPYTAGTCCCLSSGPRAMAMIPSMALLQEHASEKAGDTSRTSGGPMLVVNLFESCDAVFNADATPVGVAMRASLFEQRQVELTFLHEAPSARFGVKIRTPEWAEPLTTPGVPSGRDASGWCIIEPRDWKNNDTLTIDLGTSVRVVLGSFGNAGKAAVTYGPLVMAFDAGQNGINVPGRLLWLEGQLSPRPGDDERTIEVEAGVRVAPTGTSTRARLVPFSRAGSEGDAYRVWLGAPGRFDAATLTARDLATESRSRDGNVSGSILDDDPRTFVVTFDGTPAREDWFGVQFHELRTISRLTFRHGNTFHDGGWFDTSAAPLRVEVQRTSGGDWENMGTFAAYPRTTPRSAGELAPGAEFVFALPEPTSCIAVRVIGVPASGDSPHQAFTSCAGLWAE